MAHSIPEEMIRRIKDAADIVEVISESVLLRKAGRNHIGLCPFHAEKTPSFTVSEDKQIFYCFGCHTGGNVFSFLMQQGGLSFPDAVRSLAGRYGIDLPDPRMSPSQKLLISEKERLYRINETAMAFYQNVLATPATGQKAMSYLLARGMTRKMIDDFRLGYAPEVWDGLLRHGRSNRIGVPDLLKAGLIIERKGKSSCYDRFRGRIMFPIVNGSRQVIGFGGRVLGEELPKYLNSPETPVYNKGGSLYGIDRARQPARAASRVYVVEGYFDVLAMHLYGFDNTVASLGTALTPEHVQLLKGMVGASGKAVLVYDADQAGIKAALRSISVFEQGLLDARILALPSGYDPDLFLREHGAEAFHKADEKAVSMMEYLMESVISQFGLSLPGKVKIVAALEKPLTAIQDTVARSLYIKQLAERLAIDEAVILQKYRQTAPRRPVTAEPKVERLSDGRDCRRLERQILALLLHHPEIMPEFMRRNLVDHFEDPQMQTIARLLVQYSVGREYKVADILSQIEDGSHRNLVAQISVMEDHWDRAGCERLLAQFESRHLRRTRDDLQRQIIDAEKNNDIDLLSKLLRQKQTQASKKV